MAVIRKRRTPHTKSSRQQQLQQQQQLRAKQRFENSRLQPEQATTMIHDESDTISYRSYLLMNFVRSAEYMDILTTQLVANDKIRPPRLFRESATLEAMRQRLGAQKEQLSRARQALETFSWDVDEDSRFLKDKLAKSESDGLDSDALLKEYLQHFGLRSQNGKAVFYESKFSDLRGDTREAPPDYWQKHALMIREQQKKALLLKKEQEEAERERLRLVEEHRRKLEMEEAARREERQKQMQLEQLRRGEQMAMPGGDEEALFQQPGQHNQSSFLQSRGSSHSLQFGASGQTAQYSTTAPQDILQQSQQPQQSTDVRQLPHGQHQAQSELMKQEQEQRRERQAEAQQQQQQQPQQPQKQPQQQPQQQEPPQDAMESIFGDFDNEPFNNGFEDDFGDLDTAFF